MPITKGQKRLMGKSATDIIVGGFNLILLMIWSGLTEEIYNEQFYFISYTVIVFLMIGSILTLRSIFFSYFSHGRISREKVCNLQCTDMKFFSVPPLTCTSAGTYIC